MNNIRILLLLSIFACHCVHVTQFASSQDAQQPHDGDSSKMTSRSLTITPPNDLGVSAHAWSFKNVTNIQQCPSDVVETSSENALHRTGWVDLDGNENWAKPNRFAPDEPDGWQ